MIGELNIGDVVRLTAKFRRMDTGALADPDSITLKVKTPAGVVSTIPADQVKKDATGCYHSDLALTASGSWWVHWEGTGDVQAAEEISFRVQTSQVV